MADNIQEIKKLQDEALAKLPEQIASKAVKSLDEDEVLQKYKGVLDDLRKDGVNKIMALRQEITAAKKNKMLDKAQCEDIVDGCKKQIAAAKIVAARNKDADKQITKEAVAYANKISAAYIKQVDEEQTGLQAKHTENYKKQVADIKARAAARIAKLSD
ncbi:MAG: hypothetical protein J5747_04070, partial [Spirochaetaceae bacterium]|nr:hypothetical protein [Spirochaetaceae bacterium]